MYTRTHDVEMLVLPEHADLLREHLPEGTMRRHGNTVAITVGCQQQRDPNGKLTGWVIDPTFRELCEKHGTYTLHTLEPQALAEAV